MDAPLCLLEQVAERVSDVATCCAGQIGINSPLYLCNMFSPFNHFPWRGFSVSSTSCQKCIASNSPNCVSPRRVPRTRLNLFTSGKNHASGSTDACVSPVRGCLSAKGRAARQRQDVTTLLSPFALTHSAPLPLALN